MQTTRGARAVASRQLVSAGFTNVIAVGRLIASVSVMIVTIDLRVEVVGLLIETVLLRVLSDAVPIV